MPEGLTPCNALGVKRWVLITLAAILGVSGMIAAAIAIYAKAYTPPDRTGQIVALEAQVLALNTTQHSYLTEGDLLTQNKYLQTQIDCLAKFADNTQIVWGGSLPPNDYFLTVSSKDKYAKGCH